MGTIDGVSAVSAAVVNRLRDILLDCRPPGTPVTMRQRNRTQSMEMDGFSGQVGAQRANVEDLRIPMRRNPAPRG
jgi:hypothetical protein